MTSGTDDIVWQKDEWKAEIGFEEEPHVIFAKAGDILAFDYRVLHRAVANDTDYARPVLYVPRRVYFMVDLFDYRNPKP